MASSVIAAWLLSSSRTRAPASSGFSGIMVAGSKLVRLGAGTGGATASTALADSSMPVLTALESVPASGTLLARMVSAVSSAGVFGLVSSAAPPPIAAPDRAPITIALSTSSIRGLSRAMFWAICSTTDCGSSSSTLSANMPPATRLMTPIWLSRAACMEPCTMAVSKSAMPIALAAFAPAYPKAAVPTPAAADSRACFGVR